MRLLSSEHFLVDGTLIEAWASMKSLKPDPPADTGPRGGGRNAPADFRGEKRSNATHRSTTDPDARLYRKGPGIEARLSYIRHGLMENRSGLIVDARLTRVSGHAERLAALDMMEPWTHRSRAIKRRPSLCAVTRRNAACDNAGSSRIFYVGPMAGLNARPPAPLLVVPIRSRPCHPCHPVASRVESSSRAFRPPSLRSSRADPQSRRHSVTPAARLWSGR